MICANCGKYLEDSNRFCRYCGVRLERNERIEKSTDNASSAPAPSHAIEHTLIDGIKNAFFDDEQGCSETNATENASFRLHRVNDDGELVDPIPLVNGDNIIGRHCSQLSCDRCINPHHVKITCSGKHAVIQDLHSLNGVFLRLSGDSAELPNGGCFRIGEQLLSLSLGNSNQSLPLFASDDNAKPLGGIECTGWGYLRVISGAASHTNVFRLVKNGTLLGRNQGDIRFLRDAFVSSLHASLSLDHNRIILTDLNSSNGTFLRLYEPLHVTCTTFLLIGNKLLCLQPV